MFEAFFGRLPGDRPSTYWSPDLGHVVGLRPRDIGALTASQLLAAKQFAKNHLDAQERQARALSRRRR